MIVRPRLVASVFGAAVITVSLGLALSPAASANDPPGNNGFIKVDDQPIDDIPNNQPHVGCTFHIDFYNYDEGDDLSAEVGFELKPPTAGAGYTLEVDGPSSVFIGEDPSGGGDDLATTEIYTLTITGEPHPEHGYHVKL